MVGRDIGHRLLVGLISLCLLAGCGAGRSPTLTPTPVTFEPVTLVTGTAKCPGGTDFDFTTDADGTKHVRDDYHAERCTVTTDDPRVSGTRSSTWNIDLWGSLGVSFELVQWGTQRLENDGGAWEGSATGVAVFPSSPGDIIAHWYRGTGGYAGFSYFELWTGLEPWKVQGQIFPGDPPPPYAEGTTITRLQADGPVADDAVAVVTGTADCPGLDFAFTADPEGIWHVRDDYHADRCTVTTDEPRVTGVRSSTWNFDVWGNPSAGVGAGVQWGTARLVNDGGAWEGRGTGVVSLPGRGDIIVNWYKGTGGYEGLAYFELWTGSGPWTIQGQIFPGDPPTP